eukprot:7376566-Prymnesium_polylepis.1
MAPVDTPSPSQQTQQQQQVPVPQVPQQAGNTKRDKWYAPNFDGLWQRHGSHARSRRPQSKFCAAIRQRGQSLSACVLFAGVLVLDVTGAVRER